MARDTLADLQNMQAYSHMQNSRLLQEQFASQLQRQTSPKTEYKVREVTRYIVTRYEAAIPDPVSGNCAVGKSTQHGEYDNADMAYAVAYALAKTEHDKLGYEPGDERIQYPDLPKGVTGEGVRF